MISLCMFKIIFLYFLDREHKCAGRGGVERKMES